MTATLLDSDVLIGLIGPTSTWTQWSREALTLAVADGETYVNQAVYAEISVDFDAIEDCDWALDVQESSGPLCPGPPRFLPVARFSTIGGAGGVRRSPLPEFFVGAHAAVVGWRPLTRDAARYRTYFPTVELIAPE